MSNNDPSTQAIDQNKLNQEKTSAEELMEIAEQQDNFLDDPETLLQEEEEKEQEERDTKSSTLVKNKNVDPYAHFSEKELIERAKQGDEKAWGSLLYFTRSARGTSVLDCMKGWVYSKLKDHPNIADELVAATVLDAYKGINGFKVESVFSTWCIGILKNKTNKKLKELAGTIDYKKLIKELNEISNPKVSKYIQEITNEINNKTSDEKKVNDEKIIEKIKEIKDHIDDKNKQDKLVKWIYEINKKTIKIHNESDIHNDSNAEQNIDSEENISTHAIFNYGKSPFKSPEAELIIKQEIEQIETVIINNPSTFRNPERLFKIIFMCYVQGYSYKEIGEELGLSASTICEMLSTAQRNIRKLVKKMNE